MSSRDFTSLGMDASGRQDGSQLADRMLLTLILAGVGAGVCGYPVLAQLTALLCLVTALLRQTDCFRKWHSLPATCLDLLLLSWLLLKLGTVAFSVYPPNTWLYLQLLTTGVTFYFCLRLLVKEWSHFQTVASAGVFCAAVIAGVNLASFGFQDMQWAQLGFQNLADFKNYFPLFGGVLHGEGTGVLIAILPWPVLAITATANRFARVACLGVLGCVLMSIALSFSRGAYLGTLVFGVITTVLLIWLKVLRWKSVAQKALAIGIVLCAVLWATSTGKPVLLTMTLSGSESQARSTAGRLVMWREGIALVKEHPLIGVGEYNVPIVLPRHTVGERDRPLTGGANSFNSVLQLLQESGLAGLLVLALASLSFVALCYRIGRDISYSNESRRWTIVSLGAIAGLATHDLTFSSALVVVPVFLSLCTLLGATVSLQGVSSARSTRVRIPITLAMASVVCILVALVSLAQYCSGRSANDSFSLAVKGAEKQRFPEAALAAREATLAQPYNAAYWIGLGLFSERTAEASTGAQRRVLLDSAVRAYEQALRIVPTDACAHHNYGRLLMILGRNSEAEGPLVSAVQLDPADPVYKISLGTYYEESGAESSSIREYSKALLQAPSLTDSRWFRDLIKRRPDLANAAADRARNDLLFHLSRTGSPIVMAKLGKMKLYEGDIAGARSELEAAVARLPNLALAWANLTETTGAGSTGDAARALFLRRALFLDSSSAIIHSRICELALTSRDLSSAYDSCSKALVVAPQDHGIHFRMKYRMPHFVANDLIPAGILGDCDPPVDSSAICSGLERISHSIGSKISEGRGLCTAKAAASQ